MKLVKKIEILEKAIFFLSDEKHAINCICDAVQIQNTRFDPTDKDFISYHERLTIIDLIYRNKPSNYQFNEFTNNDFWIDDVFWWQPILSYPETRQIRIDYLKALIQQLKSK